MSVLKAFALFAALWLCGCGYRSTASVTPLDGGQLLIQTRSSGGWPIPVPPRGYRFVLPDVSTSVTPEYFLSVTFWHSQRDGVDIETEIKEETLIGYIYLDRVRERLHISLSNGKPIEGAGVYPLKWDRRRSRPRADPPN